MSRWRERFPDAELVLRMEGGSVYSAEAEGAWWLISDEAALADFLDEDEEIDLINVKRFDSREEWLQAVVAKRGVFTVLAGQRVLEQSVPLTAMALEAKAEELDLPHVNERDHLQKLSVAELLNAVYHHPQRFEIGTALKLDYPDHWPRLGNVDIVVNAQQSEPLFVELKCGAGTNALGPCAWDLLKCALALRMCSTPGAYLLAATTTADWERPIRGAELFETAKWETAVIRERYADWFRDWEKRGDPQPVLLPSLGRTTRLASRAFMVGETEWQLRLSRVEIEPDGWFEWDSMLTVPLQEP